MSLGSFFMNVLLLEMKRKDADIHFYFKEIKAVGLWISGMLGHVGMPSNSGVP